LIDGFIRKVGKPPRVFYSVALEKELELDTSIDRELEDVIENNFLIITPSGERQEGMEGFVYWCRKHRLSVPKTAKEYAETLKKYAKYKKENLIDGMYKMKHTFGQIFLDEIFYLDFYSIERFGKTKLGQLLLYAKQSQNKVLIKELVVIIKPTIELLVEKFHVGAVGFIPPTVKREVQLMKELEKQLNLSIPIVSLVKVKTQVAIPQKTLTKLEDRVENAKNTIMTRDRRKFKTILLIDDALGSGATLNETAAKIKSQHLAEKVIGLAITGSFKGFEIISEV
jgi:phosphoribosylpyrophosphate synthetase